MAAHLRITQLHLFELYSRCRTKRATEPAHFGLSPPAVVFSLRKKCADHSIYPSCFSDCIHFFARNLSPPPDAPSKMGYFTSGTGWSESFAFKVSPALSINATGIVDIFLRNAVMGIVKVATWSRHWRSCWGSGGGEMGSYVPHPCPIASGRTAARG